MRKETKERFFKAAKIGIVTLFALMTVVGSTLTLTSCTAKHNTNNNGINPMPGPGYETPIDNQQNQEVNPGENNNEQVSPGEQKPQEEIKPGENNPEENPGEQNPQEEVKPGENGEEVNPGEEQKPTEPEIDLEEQKRQQLAQLEEDIETGLVQKLNDKFGEEMVESVDVNYFTLEQDSQRNTTIFANGAIKFAGDEISHKICLGLPVDADALLKISPLYYVNVDGTKDISENYSVEDLTAYNEFISDKELQFNSAKLDDKEWNFNNLTASQVEKQLEEEYTAKCKKFFEEDLNTKYIKEVDLKYIMTEHDTSYGYMVRIVGKTSNIRNDKIENFYVQFIVTQQDYEYVKSGYPLDSIDKEKDLKDNYSFEQLNKIVEIINKDSSYVKFYSVRDREFTVTDRIYTK